ncbi:MAG: T9SS C-terminal target domain-containing protein [Flavobacteriales bacterium]|nr:T9SS C-terminal target domain-containing protein [Flavobacteriales bacterium]
MNTLRLTSSLLAITAATVLSAREVPGAGPRSGGQAGGGRAAACAPSTAKAELDLNNVRARIETGGNLWQDREGAGGPAYEVPKTPDNTGPNALFAGALWMGGLSPDNVLKLAAVRFRQVGNDYWPGPLTAYDTINHTGDASIDGSVCTEFDRTWKTYRMDAQRQDAYFRCLADPLCDPAVEFAGYTVPGYFFEWPAHGDVSKGQDYNLAPYFDSPYGEQDVYDPENGDYPGYDLKGVIDCKAKRREDAVPLFGDQNIWWVFNDKGNTHTESGGQPIGMEIRAQAFAFSTNDEINNMTFYNYVLINQGTQTLTQTYFGQWVDVDLGGANDDYVGCDVERGLGYGYNGDAVDENANGHPGYGGPNPPPPAIGVDFFEGPYQDYDGMDNPLTNNCQDAVDSLGIVYGGIGIGYGDDVTDNERYGMRAFVYHNNASGAIGDPNNAGQYYGYLKGIWGDNTPMTYGGNGYNPGGGGVRSYYMFPGSSDDLGWGTSCVPQPVWDEVTAGNAPEDRRFIQSAGPFTLEPGAYNNITVGVVYARAGGGGVDASINLMRQADDKAQSLFDNCFRILNGPDAPDMAIQELDRELILYLTNPQGSNNYNEAYVELDATIPAVSLVTTYETQTLYDTAGNVVGQFEVPTGTAEVNNDRNYRFQGYQIFQVVDATVSPDELTNTNKARLVAQVDIQDGISQLINWEANADLNMPVPVEKVNGRDTGVVHSFRILEDAFATGDPRLTNFKTYHFMALAYGYNNYQEYDPNTLTGQPYPYLAGRKSTTGSIRSYAGIPHKPSVENGGTVLNAQYGDGFEITRLEGQGNGGNRIAISKASLDAIVASPDGRINEVKYQKGLGPVNIKVVDPLKVPAGDFELWFTDTTTIPTPTAPVTYTRLQDASWMLVRLSSAPTSADTVRSTRTIQLQNEQLIPQWGLSVSIMQTLYGGIGDKYTKFLGSDPLGVPADWYAGIPDQEGEQVQNWIRSGSAVDETLEYPDNEGADPQQAYEKVMGGTWAPWAVIGRAKFQPGSEAFKTTQVNSMIKDSPSIQVVFTPDKNKWSRCVVVETCDTAAFTTPANVKKLYMRPVPSVDKNGIPTGSPGCNEGEATLVASTGMSWFPGYAVDAETGERLNIFFGENSFAGGGIGRDMLWNPSDQMYNDMGEPVFGGGHWIYVTANRKRYTTESLAANRMPQYDQCTYIRNKMGDNNATSVAAVYDGVSWVGSALLATGRQMLSAQQGLVPSELSIRLNVNKPYYIYAPPFANYTPAITNTNRNQGLPLYTFNTGSSVAETNVTSVGEDGLDLIGVVPNPYYGYSGYETTRLDNRVKFINLPRSCTISIYTVSGTLVRKYKKDNELTYLDWDLKNNYNVPISGGTYICHIEAPGLGERVIKWFGVMRPVDLQNF